MRKLIDGNDLPEFHLSEEVGQQGNPILSIQHRDTLQTLLPLTPADTKPKQSLTDKQSTRKAISAAIMNIEDTNW